MDSEKFLAKYELLLDKEFERDGEAAEWAAPKESSHRFFGGEDAIINLKEDDPDRSNGPDAEGALSPDGTYLAVSTNAVIRMYHVQSQEMRTELIGHQGNVAQLHFGPTIPEGASVTATDSSPHEGKEKYHLVSGGAHASGGDEEIIVWSLDEYGRQLGRTMPFAIHDMADRAIAAISNDLDTHHGLGSTDIKAIRTGFSEALRIADTKNRAKDIPLWNGQLPSFGTYPISPDGKSLLYTVHGGTTQHGERPPDQLPQILVVDLVTQEERCRMKGHTDAIMWAGWSPDGNTIATASWDGYYKIWNAYTGECKHTIGPTNAQNWSGAFSPDGKYVLFSGGNIKVAIYDVETGEEFAELKSEGLKLKHWIRYFAWNPAGDCIAFCNGRNIVLWHPFENKVETILQLRTDGSMLTRFNEFSTVRWAQGGRKLLLRDGDYTTFVWDREKNVKWRFQRPRGMALDVYTEDIFYVEEAGMVLSLDGDWKVRYWKV